MGYCPAGAFATPSALPLVMPIRWGGFAFMGRKRGSASPVCTSCGTGRGHAGLKGIHPEKTGPRPIWYIKKKEVEEEPRLEYGFWLAIAWVSSFWRISDFSDGTWASLPFPVNV